MTPATQRVHGGPDAWGPVPYDFSTNANACGPCPQALDAVRAADATRYPDPSYAHLRQRLAAHHGLDARRIVLAASASEFILRITGWAARGGVAEVVVPVHAYGDYAHAARVLGLRVRPAAPPGEAPVPATTLAWRCDPSSPLGEEDPGLAQAFAEAATVVLDRAYHPLRLDGAARTEGLDRAWQLWSPNKALGLTGVRGAYAIAPEGAEQAVAALDALAPSWPLGAHGVALLHAWCDPAVHDWLAASRATLRGWKQRQLALCRTLGWEPRPGVANFFVARVPGLAQRLPLLRAQGVQLRDCTSFGLPGHARLAVLPPAAQEALAVAWHAAAAISRETP